MNRQSDYQQAFDSLRFTQEQKARLAARVAEAVQQPTRRARRPFGKIAVLAACLAVVLAVGAGASGVLKSATESFGAIFGGGAAQTEVIDKIGHPIGASDTDNGITITADAIMGDAYNAAIIYTIRRDDGTPLLPEGTDPRSLLMGGFGGANLSVRGGSHGSSWFVADETDPSVIQLVQTVSADVPISRGTATAEFQDLCGWDESVGEAVTLVEGQWSNSPSGREPEEDSRQMERYFENVEILLTKTDGTVIDMSGSGGSIEPERGVTICSKGEVFAEIIPLEELESISVGGIVYPISAG